MPNTASTRPQSKPISTNRDCSAATSSPRSGFPGTKERIRSPSFQRASSIARIVGSSISPETIRPRSCWNARNPSSSTAPKFVDAVFKNPSLVKVFVTNEITLVSSPVGDMNLNKRC